MLRSYCHAKSFPKFREVVAVDHAVVDLHIQDTAGRFSKSHGPMSAALPGAGRRYCTLQGKSCRDGRKRFLISQLVCSVWPSTVFRLSLEVHRGAAVYAATNKTTPLLPVVVNKTGARSGRSRAGLHCCFAIQQHSENPNPRRHHDGSEEGRPHPTVPSVSFGMNTKTRCFPTT